MKKVIAITLMVAMMAVMLSVAALAAEYTWGFGPVEGTQGAGGWYYTYSRSQVGRGANFNPTDARNLSYLEYVPWCGATWGPAESDPPDYVDSIYDLWTDIGSIWKQYYPDGNTDPWGRVAPQGLDAAIILKWVPEQDGVYNLKAIMDLAGCPEDKDGGNGSAIYIHKGSEVLFQRNFAANERVTNVTAFDGEVNIAADEALYFSIDPREGGDEPWTNLYDEEVYWSITITRTGDLPADYVPPAVKTGVSDLVTIALVMLLISTAGAVIVVKKVKA